MIQPHISEFMTLYANNLGGDVTGKIVANDPPTWIPMINLTSHPDHPCGSRIDSATTQYQCFSMPGCNYWRDGHGHSKRADLGSVDNYRSDCWCFYLGAK